MCNPHPHRDLIHAWAEGHQIQVFGVEGWKNIDKPTWNPHAKYRIAPEVKPHIVINGEFIAVAKEPLKENQNYWYVYKHSSYVPFVTMSGMWSDNDQIHSKRLKCGIVFLTLEDAQRAADKLNAIFTNPIFCEVNHDK